MLSRGCSSFGQSRVVMAGSGQGRVRAAPCNTLQEGEQGLTLTLIDRQGSRRPSTSLPFLHFAYKLTIMSLFGTGHVHLRLQSTSHLLQHRLSCRGGDYNKKPPSLILAMCYWSPLMFGLHGAV